MARDEEYELGELFLEKPYEPEVQAIRIRVENCIEGVWRHAFSTTDPDVTLPIVRYLHKHREQQAAPSPFQTRAAMRLIGQR
jgi:hypothetical protein